MAGGLNLLSLVAGREGQPPSGHEVTSFCEALSAACSRQEVCPPARWSLPSRLAVSAQGSALTLSP